jgi:serine/arginine repetitive matrix protein 1
MQMMLTGFLEKKTPDFMKELWRLLLSAQASPLKVPPEFIELKKAEMRQRQEESERALTRRDDEVREVRSGQERMDGIRARERADRPVRDNGYGNRGPATGRDEGVRSPA